MQVSSLVENSKVVNLVGTIESLEEVKELSSGLKVQDGVLSDATGQVKLSLFEPNSGIFKVGDKVIINGWVKKYQEELQVSTGKFGTIKPIPAEKE